MDVRFTFLTNLQFSLISTTEIEDMVPKMSQVFEADTMQRVACRPPRGRPEPEVWWERAGQRVPTEGRVYQEGLDLVFRPTEAGDSGTYTCVARNKAGRKTQNFTFTVASELYTCTLNQADWSQGNTAAVKHPVCDQLPFIGSILMLQRVFKSLLIMNTASCNYILQV